MSPGQNDGRSADVIPALRGGPGDSGHASVLADAMAQANGVEKLGPEHVGRSG